MPILNGFTHVAVMALLVFFSWWLSWYDPQVIGADVKKDFLRRGIRCLLTLILAELAILRPWELIPHNHKLAGWIYFVIAGAFVLLWADCIAALVITAFARLVQSRGDLGWKLDHTQRELDKLAFLVRSDRRKEAIQLCLKLKRARDASVLALETILDHLGVPQPVVKIPNPLADASRLRKEGKFGEAEKVLKTFLSDHNENHDAALMLIRLYAQEMRRPDKAEKILRKLEKQPFATRAHVEFARRSIPEWSQLPLAPESVELPSEDVAELLSLKLYGTAVEVLEKQTAQKPEDFDLRLKLAELYAVEFGQVSRAEAIVKEIQENSAFNPEQIQTAKARLAGWQLLR